MISIFYAHHERHRVSHKKIEIPFGVLEVVDQIRPLYSRYSMPTRPVRKAAQRALLLIKHIVNSSTRRNKHSQTPKEQEDPLTDSVEHLEEPPVVLNPPEKHDDTPAETPAEPVEESELICENPPQYKTVLKCGDIMYTIHSSIPIPAEDIPQLRAEYVHMPLLLDLVKQQNNALTATNKTRFAERVFKNLLKIPMHLKYSIKIRTTILDRLDFMETQIKNACKRADTLDRLIYKFNTDVQRYLNEDVSTDFRVNITNCITTMLNHSKGYRKWVPRVHLQHLMKKVRALTAI